MMIDKQDVLSIWHETRSLRRTAATLGLSTQTVRRILLDAGEACAEEATNIRLRLDAGETPEAIASALGVTVKTVRAYCPYQRGSYAVGEKTEEALKVASWRERKKRNSPPPAT